MIPDWGRVPEPPEPPTDLALAPRCWLVLDVAPEAPGVPDALYAWYLTARAVVLLTLLPLLLVVLEGKSEPE